MQLTPGGPLVSLEDLAATYGQSEKKDGGGLTPLVYAAREGCFQCIQILLESGAKGQPRNKLRLDCSLHGHPKPPLQAGGLSA